MFKVLRKSMIFQVKMNKKAQNVLNFIRSSAVSGLESKYNLYFAFCNRRLGSFYEYKCFFRIKLNVKVHAGKDSMLMFTEQCKYNPALPGKCLKKGQKGFYLKNK